MVIERVQGAHQSLFVFQKNTKHEIANINAITINPVPINHVTSKEVVIYPLIALCDERKSTRYGIM